MGQNGRPRAARLLAEAVIAHAIGPSWRMWLRASVRWVASEQWTSHVRLATSSDSPAHLELAETLRSKPAWLYASPALYPDVWTVLSRCAERTSRIGLGPGVLIPSLRHPMVNAAAIAELPTTCGASELSSPAKPASGRGRRSVCCGGALSRHVRARRRRCRRTAGRARLAQGGRGLPRG